MLSIIVAMSQKNHTIGLKGDMPWKLSADLKRFKKITTGHTVVMGRKTWESIPAKYRPLPNRKNIVLTRQEGYLNSLPEGVGVAGSFEEALATHKALSQSPVADEWGNLFVIGGASVFGEALPLADRIYLTWVDYEEDGDIFFPASLLERFEHDPEIAREIVPADKKNSNGSEFVVMRRKTAGVRDG